MRNPIEYLSVIKSNDTIISLGNNPRDINLFLPVRGRLTFLAPCLTHIHRAAEEARIRVNVTVIENDDSPKYKNFCESKGVDYIFISTNVSCSDGMFAKALCYNIGFLKSIKTEWNVFHDLDILVDRYFFKDLSTYLKPESSWVQPYTKKRVMRLNKEETKNIIREPEISTNLKGLGTPSNPGSPGGSIVVRSSDFINVGGYDPEYFYGYSPEDAFFWAKLEVLYKEHSHVFETHFQGSAVYADDPEIEVYHLDHPNLDGTNPKHNLMLNYLGSYYRAPYQSKRSLIDSKKEHFCEVLNKVELGVVDG